MADCQRTTAVYFANGMFNEYSDADQSLSAIKQVLEDQSPKKVKQVAAWKIAYNTNENFLKQIWQVFDQKRSEARGNFWSSLFNLLSRSEWARTQTTSILKQIGQDQTLKDADLRKQLLDYISDLKHGYSVITVAHSQGNFYSLFAFDRLSDWSNRLHLISVATPAGRTLSNGYVTLESDAVITTVPTALPANARKPNPGLFDHKFIEDYLESSEPLSYVLGEFNDLLGPGDPSDVSMFSQGVFDESLDPVLDWFREYFKKPTELERPKCLLFWALVDLFNVNDSDEFSCKDRNLKSVEESLRDCRRDIVSIEGGRTTCPFAGPGAAAAWDWGAWGILSTKEIVKFRDINRNCNWRHIGDLETDLGIDGITKTQEFLKAIIANASKGAKTDQKPGHHVLTTEAP